MGVSIFQCDETHKRKVFALPLDRDTGSAFSEPEYFKKQIKVIGDFDRKG